LSKDERTLLEAIAKALPEERAKGGVRFAAQKDGPNGFVLPEETAPRSAITGSRVGAPIYFNLDLIGSLTPFSATALLVHELGHHQGIADHHALEELGAKAQRGLEAASTPLDSGTSRVTVFNLDPVARVRSLQPFPIFFVSDGETLHDVSSLLRDLPMCHARTAMGVGLELRNLFWDEFPPSSPNAPARTVSVTADARALCAEANGTSEQPQVVHLSFVVDHGRISKDSFLFDALYPGSVKTPADMSFHLVASTPKRVTDGGKWNLEGELTVDREVAAVKCVGLLRGEFFRNQNIRAVAPTLDECSLTAKGPHRYHVSVSHTFLPETRPRRYYMPQLEIYFAGVKQPVLVTPDGLPAIDVSSAHPGEPIEVIEMKLHGIKPALSDATGTYYIVPEKTWLLLDLKVRSTTRPVSGVVGYDFWREGSSTVGGMMTELFSRRDTLPFSDGTTLTELGKGLWLIQLKFQFPQQGWVMDQVEFSEGLLINRAYQDTHFEFRHAIRIDIDRRQ
jgi:hypothetical protein